MRKAPEIILSPADRQTLEKWARGPSTPVRLMQRAQIMLLASEGITNKDIALRLGVTRLLAGRWRSRFAKLGLSGIEKDAPRGGAQADPAQSCRAGDHPAHDRDETRQRHPLDLAYACAGVGRQPVDGYPSMARQRTETAFG